MERLIEIKRVRAREMERERWERFIHWIVYCVGHSPYTKINLQFHSKPSNSEIKYYMYIQWVKQNQWSWFSFNKHTYSFVASDIASFWSNMYVFNNHSSFNWYVVLTTFIIINPSIFEFPFIYFNLPRKTRVNLIRW